MAQDDDRPQDAAWSFTAEATVEHVAASAAGGWALVADGERNIYVLDEEGAVRGRFRAGQPVRRLRIDQRGALFAALSGDTIVYAFNARGDLDWRVELGGPVTDFDLDPTGEQLAAISPAGWLYSYSPSTRQRHVAPVGWPMTLLAAVDGESMRVVVCNAKGRAALLGVEGNAHWDRKLGGRVGDVSASGSGDLIAIAARDRGLLLLRLDGQEVGTVRVGQEVVRAEMTPDGSLIMVQTAKDKLVLVNADSKALWEKSPDHPLAAWAFGQEGRMVVAAAGDRQVVAYGVEVGPSDDRRAGAPRERARPVQLRKESSPSPAAVAAPLQAEREEWPEHFQLEAPLAEHPAQVEPPAAAACRVAWKKRLPEALLPVEQSLFRLSADGGFLVAMLADGRPLVVAADGERVVHDPVGTPALIAPRTFGRVAAVWDGRRLLVVEPAAGQARTAALGDEPAPYFDCSADCSLFCTANEAGVLRAFGGRGTPLWQRTIPGRPVGLHVSPEGDTILVPEAEGRFRYYDAEGRLVRKFRFADADERRLLGLGEGFSVFAGPAGRLTVLGADGREMWSRSLFPKVTGLELLGWTLAAYGEGGACAAVDPREDSVWEFLPPPGRVLLRRPIGSDPMVVHAAGSVVTVFRGYRRKLDVVWRYDCGAEVTLMDADWDGRAVVALAGQRIYRMERADAL